MVDKCPKCGAGESLLTPAQPKWMQETLREFWACATNKNLKQRGHQCYEAELARKDAWIEEAKELLGDVIFIATKEFTADPEGSRTWFSCGVCGEAAKRFEQIIHLDGCDITNAQALLARIEKFKGENQ